MEKTVSEAIQYRRSVRVFRDDIELDDEKVRQCLHNATLAPTSSNLQLWEFYHVTNKEKRAAISKACFDQPAAKNAKQLVVVVTRKDLWKQHAKANLNFIQASFAEKPLDQRSQRDKFATNYYKKIIPTLYTDFLGILGGIKYCFFQIVGLFRPVYRQVRASDMRIVAHKSAGLAAQNFMISMAAIGYDTCPMEGNDTARIKKVLDLPRGAGINMVIGCGVRDEKGIYGPRFRVPFEQVYKKV